MAGHSPSNVPELKGIEKYINSYTLKGRLNGAYASVAFWSVVFLTARHYMNKPKEIKLEEVKG